MLLYIFTYTKVRMTMTPTIFPSAYSFIKDLLLVYIFSISSVCSLYLHTPSRLNYFLYIKKIYIHIYILYPYFDCLYSIIYFSLPPNILHMSHESGQRSPSFSTYRSRSYFFIFLKMLIRFFKLKLLSLAGLRMHIHTLLHSPLLRM